MKISKKSLYITIYDKIYSKIADGTYEEGKKLPSELKLCNTYNVSRTTIREALLLLKENGYIYTISGSGTFVKKRELKNLITLNELNETPLFFSKKKLTSKIEKIVFEVPTSHYIKSLNLTNSDIVLAAHKMYYDDKRPVSYAFIVIPLSVLKESSINLSDKEEIKIIINNITNIAENANTRILFTEAGESLKNKLNIKLKDKIILIEETLYSNKNKPIAQIRYSMISDNYEFFVKRKGR